MSELLQSKLATVRTKRTFVHVVTGVAMAVAIIVLVTAATAMLDWWLELSFITRALILALELSVVIVVLGKLAVWPVMFGPDEETLALAVEREHPLFASRLISAIQLLRPDAVAAGVAVGMVKHLVRETEEMAGSIDFGQVVKTKQMARIAALAVAIVAAGGALTAYGESTAVDLIKRAVLIPGVEVPRKTRVIITDGDKFVAKGDAVTIKAVADGVQPKQGTVRATSSDGTVHDYAIERDPDVQHGFKLTIDAVPDSFSYVVRLNDGTSQLFKVSVAERPTVSAITVEQIYPKYTGLKQKVQAQGDSTFLAGSRMVLKVTSTKPLLRKPGADGKRSVVRLIGSNVEFPLQLDINSAFNGTAADSEQQSIPLPNGTRAFRVELVDENGIPSKNETEYRIDLVPDRPPTLAVTSPTEREVMVTTKGKIDVGFDASDDFALSKLLLKYRLVPPDESTMQITGLNVTYFNGQELKGPPIFQRIDPTVDFNFGQPAIPNVPDDNFSARWQGYVRPKESGKYIFHFEVDDGVRFWVDGKLLLEAWNPGYFQLDSKPIVLEANKAYDIKIEYFEVSGGAGIHMQWKREGGEFEVVPEDCLLNLSAAEVLGSGKKYAERTIDLDVGQSPKSKRGFYPWAISSLGADAVEGASFEWWLEARDANDVTGPGVTSSDKYVFRIVSEADKRAELMAKLGEYFQTIESVRSDQVDLSVKLGGMVQERTTQPLKP